MLAAQADFVVDGPDVSVHVHGDGPVLFADLRGGVRLFLRIVVNAPRVRRFARELSRSLQAAHLRIDVRFKGWTIMRLG